MLCLSIPFAAPQVSVNPAVTWLVMFYAVTMIIFTMYRGGFATIPAYLADMFGTKHVDGVHGRLLAANTVTIAGLMQIAPAGTLDPTPSLYNSTMYAMAALLVIALFANMMVRPVHKRHHMAAEEPKVLAGGAAGGAATGAAAAKA